MIEYYLHCKLCDSKFITQPRNHDSLKFKCKCSSIYITQKMLLQSPAEFMKFLKNQGIRATVEVLYNDKRLEVFE